MAKTRIGVVEYLNARPLIRGLDEESNLRLVAKKPAQLSTMLRTGKLDVALVSSIECFREPDFRILPEMGICSEGAIKSVKLYLRKAPEDVRRVALDPASRSAATLTRLVFAEFFQNLEVEYFETRKPHNPAAVDADAVLLIGDPALSTRPDDLETIDLGALWTERTGLPFVYAVWTCLEPTPAEAFLSQLLKARDRGLLERPRIAQDAAKELGLPAAGLVQYLTRNLRYELGEREIKGLERFRDIAFEHQLCNRHDVPFVGTRVQAV